MLHSLVFLLAAAGPAAAAPSNCAAASAFTGTICSPQSAGKHPAIVLLGGSEGGDMMGHAAPMFAERGYVAASVAYFGAPGLPQTLENVPVETVGKAIADVASRPDVDSNRIAILGISKGGELALLTASLYPQVRAVVAVVPSPFAWQGIGRGAGPSASSWTYRGQPLAYVPYGTAMGAQFGQAFTTHAPLKLRNGYDGSYQEHAAAVSAAMFHLENIKGPVLFIAAGDDGIWNSPQQSQLGLDYLRGHHHPYADEYENYPGAGHIFLFSSPEHPMTTVPMGPLTLNLGGSVQANAQARAQAWPKIYAFLDNALR